MNLSQKDDHQPSSRRKFLTQTAQLASLGLISGWIPFGQMNSAEAGVFDPVPVNFPSTTPLYKQLFKNWSGEIIADGVWTCAPKSAAEVVTLVNWALYNGYRIRPRGHMHNWSPLTLAVDGAKASVVLLDTTQYLTAVSVDTASTPARVTAQTGVSLESLLATLESYGLGVTAAPLHRVILR